MDDFMKRLQLTLIKNNLLAISCLTTLFALSIPDFAMANPEGGTISAGDAIIEKSGNRLDITQQSEKAIIDWRSFNVAPNELTQFHQPSSNSITLNRVNSNNSSYIQGQLVANGNIIIINQNGIIFSKNAKIDVNGIIATTIDIENNQFMKSTNQLSFNKPGKANASIINNGSITAKEAGLVGIIAPNVINNGVIIANSGQVQLASGDSFTIDLYGDKLLEVSVTERLKTQLIANNGLIQANGGKIILTAAAGKEIVDSLIEIKGELKAPAVGKKNGEIFIYAEGSNAVINNIADNKGVKQGSSKVLVTAKLDISGQKPTEKGGKIIITGDNVALLDGTLIDARGYSAGGDIQIGGDYLGKGTTPTAENLYVDKGALILNDALNSGNAGRSIFWSDDTTQFYGNVYARALGDQPIDSITWNASKGGNIGDGGFVETSGHRLLDTAGQYR